jgi:Reverse transcriptase (RNA-dependent DNA polymerase).
MHDLEDIVRCCTQGFPLRYEGDRERHVETANGKTCQENPEVTADELRKEVAKGHIAGPYSEPPLPGFKVVPRGLKEEPTKFRPISQGNKPIGDSVNEGIPRAEHIQLARTRDIDRRIRRCMEETGEVWIAKADIKAAYRTMPVRPEDWQLQGIKWNGEYYIDLRMSFGCRSSVDQWLRFSDALAWSLQRMGVNAPHYVDDFLFIASSEQECQEQVDKFKFICRSWGVTLKEQKDCGPAQVITA